MLASIDASLNHGETGLSHRSVAPIDDNVTVHTKSYVESLIRSRYKPDNQEYLESEDWEKTLLRYSGFISEPRTTWYDMPQFKILME